jgi:arylformamidase
MSFYKDNNIYIYNNIIDNNQKYNQETVINIESHTGTHIDYPAHCIKNGKFGEEYPIDYLCSNKVQILNIDLRKQDIPKITLTCNKQQKINKNTEILFIKTFFSKIRNSNKYIWKSPIIDSEIPIYLKKTILILKLRDLILYLLLHNLIEMRVRNVTTIFYQKKKY